MVRGRLGRRIGRVWRIGRVFVKGGIGRPQSPVYLVGRDMVEAVGASAALVQPDGLCRLQQRVRAVDIGVDKRIGAVDRAVHMAFSREVDGRVDRAVLEQQIGRASGRERVCQYV